MANYDEYMTIHDDQIDFLRWYSLCFAQLSVHSKEKSTLLFNGIIGNMINSVNEPASVILSGTISCKAALESGRFEPACLMVDPKKRSRDIAYIISLARRRHIPVEPASKVILDTHARGHGGIVLEAHALPLPVLEASAESGNNDSERNKRGLCVYLDGVEDPYNMGSCVRSLYAAGVSKIILPARNWENAAGTLMKASAGAWARADLAVVSGEESLMRWAAAEKLPVYSAYRGKESVSSFSVRWPESMLLVIGGALRGISAKILEHTDVQVHIPYGRDFRNALDTPSAAAVLAFEWLASQPGQEPGSAEKGSMNTETEGEAK